jgi:hypothetical protein
MYALNGVVCVLVATHNRARARALRKISRRVISALHGS